MFESITVINKETGQGIDIDYTIDDGKVKVLYKEELTEKDL